MFINMIQTVQKLNIDFDSSIELEVKDIGESLYNLFKDYDNKKPKIDRNKIEEDIISIIEDLIHYDIDEDGNLIPEHKKEHLHYTQDPEFPDENYDWKYRIDEYGIEKILEEMKKLNISQMKKSNSSESNDKLREKLWNDFITKKSLIKNKKNFVKEWVKSRDAAVTEGSKFISEKRAYSILNECIKVGDIVHAKKKNGAPTKFTDEARLCLLATVMDILTITD